MKILTGGKRTAFLAFFISHIPITLLIDAQAVFSVYYPEPLRELIRWYCNIFGDVLMRYPSPSWFQSLVLGEVLLQLPFFVVAIRVIQEHNSCNSNIKDAQRYPPWFRNASLVYGAHVSTTLIPILTTFWTSEEMHRGQVLATSLIYSPYLLFPLALLWHAVSDEPIAGYSMKED